MGRWVCGRTALPFHMGSGPMGQRVGPASAPAPRSPWHKEKACFGSAPVYQACGREATSAQWAHRAHTGLIPPRGSGGCPIGFVGFRFDPPPPPHREVSEWPCTAGGEGVTPPPPLDPPHHRGEKRNSPLGKLSGHFWYTNSWVPDPTPFYYPPPPPSWSSADMLQLSRVASA